MRAMPFILLVVAVGACGGPTSYYRTNLVLPNARFGHATAAQEAGAVLERHGFAVTRDSIPGTVVTGTRRTDGVVQQIVVTRRSDYWEPLSRGRPSGANLAVVATGPAIQFSVAVYGVNDHGGHQAASPEARAVARELAANLQGPWAPEAPVLRGPTPSPAYARSVNTGLTGRDPLTTALLTALQPLGYTTAQPFAGHPATLLAWKPDATHGVVELSVTLVYQQDTFRRYDVAVTSPSASGDVDRVVAVLENGDRVAALR